jgi:preprotein translocase subunit SecE
VADKNDKVKQPNAMQRWFRETMGELRKVSWPTRQEAQRLTGIVVAVMIAMSLLLGLLDYIFSSLVTLILS